MIEQHGAAHRVLGTSSSSKLLDSLLINFLVIIGFILLFIFITADSSGELSSDPSWESALDDESYCVVWGDFDNDGDLDLASGNNGPNHIYENIDGELLPDPVWESVDNEDTTVTQEIMWGDIDGNGWLDLVAVNGAWGAGYDVVYLNFDGIVSTQANWTSENSDHSAGMDLGDFDGDDDLDLVTANYNGRECIYENVDGMFTVNPVWESYLNDDGTQDAVFLDVDGDDDLDLYFGCSATMDSLDSNADVMYFNDPGLWGDRRYGILPDWTANNELWTTTVKAGDIDGDDDVDIIAANGYNNNDLVVMYENTGATLDRDYSWSIGVSWPFSCALGDVDQDGWLDVAIASYNDKVYLVKNDNGVLAGDFAWESSDVCKSYRCAWGDVDNDTFPDLAVANYNTTSTPGNNVMYANVFMKPTVIIIKPKEGEEIRGSFWISGEANGTPEYDLDLVEVSINDGESWYPANGTESWVYQWFTQEVPDGEYMIMARSRAGPLVSESEVVNVTVNNPENLPPNVEILSPDSNGDEADENLLITWTATDEDPDMLTIELFSDIDEDHVNGMELIESNLENTGEYLWDTSEIEEGEYYICLRVDDNNGSIVVLHSEGTVTIVHKVPVGHQPEIEIVSIEILDTSTMEVIWNAWDEDEGDLLIDIYFDDDTVFANGAILLSGELENTGNLIVDIANISPGTGYFLLVVTDEQGETGIVYSELWHIVEHLIEPEFEVIELVILPSGAEIKEGDGLTIRAVVTNHKSVNREGNVSLVIDGSLISMQTVMLRPGREESIVFNWISVLGNHNITVRVEYNTTSYYMIHELSQLVFVNSVQPIEKGEDDEIEYVWIGIGALIVVCSSAVFVFIAHKHGKGRIEPRSSCPQCGEVTTYYREYDDSYCKVCEEYVQDMNDWG